MFQAIGPARIGGENPQRLGILIAIDDAATFSTLPGTHSTQHTRIDFGSQRYSYAQPECGLVSLGAFAGIGLLLTAIAVFSVMAYAVSVQTHEIGIRVTLGAQRAEILRKVLSKGLGLVIAGILIGLATSALPPTACSRVRSGVYRPATLGHSPLSSRPVWLSCGS